MSSSNSALQPNDSNGLTARKLTSQKKIEASRKNAKRSTGPKTATGKKFVSRNAIKHGLLAREVVINAGDGKEDGEEFDTLLHRLWDYYKPVQVVEEMLVERIATSWWRLARVQQAETAEIRKNLDSAPLNYYLTAANQLNLGVFQLDALRIGKLFRHDNQADRKLSSEERLLTMQKLQSDLKQSKVGAALLREGLEGIKRELVQTGRISKVSLEWLTNNFGLSDYNIVAACASANEDDHEETAKVEGVPTEARCSEPKVTLPIIEHLLRRLELTEQLGTKKQELEEDAIRHTFCLPSEEATDKLQRYEAHLERQFYRAMDQLERIQRRRTGESVPPPLSVRFAK